MKQTNVQTENSCSVRWSLGLNGRNRSRHVRALIIVTFVCGMATAQRNDDTELARMLSNPDSRQRAIEEILARPDSKIPMLLSWTRKPPSQVNEFGLSIGLIDAFGEMKSKEAIPFLIKNISRQRSQIGAPNIFLKSAQAIESRVPAVAALIRATTNLTNPHRTAKVEAA
jgi:hypothetical protein